MQIKRKRRKPVLSPEDFGLDHPFVRWYAGFHRRGAARCSDKDLLMGPLASRRFSIGLDDDGATALGVAEDDLEAIGSIKWSSAFLMRRIVLEPNQAGSDWVVLGCKDARMEGGGASGPVPLRLWLPTSRGLLDGWLGSPEGQQFKMVEVAIRNGKPQHKGGEPMFKMPLRFQGAWKEKGMAP